MHSLRHQWGLLTSPLARAALVACETPKRCSANITLQAITAGQRSVYVYDRCHEEQSLPQQDKPPSGRALVIQSEPEQSA